MTQGVADVEWLGGVVETIGANVFAVSPSGSGKTLMLKLLMESVHQFLNEDPQQKFQPLIEDVTRQVLPSQLADFRFAWLSTDEAGQIMPLLEGGAPWLAKMLDARPVATSACRNRNCSTCRLSPLGTSTGTADRLQSIVPNDPRRRWHWTIPLAAAARVNQN